MSFAKSFEDEEQANLWSEGVFKRIGEEHGTLAVKRVRSLYRLAIDNRNLPIDEKLSLVNVTLNQLPWISDKDNWSQVAYWATPMETLTKFGGDCEDIAIAKFMMLRLMGVKEKHLRLAYVKVKRTNEAHMVLVYSQEGRSPVVLDNLEDVVLQHEKRNDLIAVYLVDKKGTITLISEKNGKRTVTAVLDNRKLEKLDTIREKISSNLREYEVFNNGYPLF